MAIADPDLLRKHPAIDMAVQPASHAPVHADRQQPHSPPTMSTSHRTRKRFGQHFLHDPGVLQRIIRSIAPRRGDTLVEIGPGLGALTRPLLAQTDHLHAVELDRDVIPHLREACNDAPGELTIHQADALQFDFSALGQRLRVVGNLPYNISTPLLFHLLSQAEYILDMHFMLQREVVKRMAAGPGDAAYGRLSVTLAVRAQVQALFTVGPGAFRPPPRVESAVVRVIPATPAFAPRDHALFNQIVTRAFGKRRKTLANALRGLVDREVLLACDIDPGTRAERVSPAEFARLADHIGKNR